MKNIKLFMLIFRETHMFQFLAGFGIFFVIACTLIWMIDPSIPTLWDAFWFGFMVITTIGFGDYTVTSWFCRVLAAFLGLYGIVLSGFICGVGASYLFEKVKMGRDESVTEMIWQLRHLDQLDDDKIASLQKKINLHQAEKQRMQPTAAPDTSIRKEQ